MAVLGTTKPVVVHRIAELVVVFGKAEPMAVLDATELMVVLKAKGLVVAGFRIARPVLKLLAAELVKGRAA